MSEDSDQEVVLPTVLSNLTNVIDSDLHNFVSGCASIQSSALNATKFLFDLGERFPFLRKGNVVAVSLVVDPGSLVLSWLNFFLLLLLRSLGIGIYLSSPHIRTFILIEPRRSTRNAVPDKGSKWEEEEVSPQDCRF